MTAGEEVSESNGEYFEIRDLFSGHYIVGFVHGNKVKASKSVDLTEGATESIDLILDPETAQGESIDVQVYDAFGSSPKDPRFQIIAKSDDGDRHFDVEKVRLQDGSFRLHPDEDCWAAIHDHDCKLAAVVAGLGSKAVMIPSNLIAPIVITFSEPAYVRVSVEGYNGSAYEGQLSASLKPVEGSITPVSDWDASEWSFPTKILPGGEVRLGPVGAGRYRVVIEYLRQNVRPIVEEATELSPGDNVCSLSLPELYTLTLRFPGDATGRSVFIERYEPGQAWSSVSAEDIGGGSFVFRALPRGSYHLITDEGKTMWVTVDRSMEREFIPNH